MAGLPAGSLTAGRHRVVTLQVWRLGKFFEMGYVVIAFALLANAVLIFVRVEDVAARSSLE
jgi:hypothetical protein